MANSGPATMAAAPTPQLSLTSTGSTHARSNEDVPTMAAENKIFGRFFAATATGHSVVPLITRNLKTFRSLRTTIFETFRKDSSWPKSQALSNPPNVAPGGLNKGRQADAWVCCVCFSLREPLYYSPWLLLDVWRELAAGFLNNFTGKANRRSTLEFLLRSPCQPTVRTIRPR